MTPDDYECKKCHASMYVPDGMDPLEDNVRFCTDCAYTEIERLQKDADRLRWLAGCDDGSPVIEALACLYDDFWHYLGNVIRQRIGEDNDDGSDEGTPDDRMTAFRNMIDDAIKTEKERTL